MKNKQRRRSSVKTEDIESSESAPTPKPRIVIESLDQLSDRWIKALKGKVKNRRRMEILSAANTETIARLLRNK